jgi:thymidine phosphorylase
MVELGKAHQTTTVALLTDMTTPLGYAVGNAVEVTESVEVLAGGGPADVALLTLTLAREMLAAAGIAADPAEALKNGRAMDSWRALVHAQGGDPDAPLPAANESETVRADRDGYVAAVDAYAIGVAAWRLGAGRARKEDPVSAAAGVVLHKKPGDAVRRGEALFDARTDDPGRIPAALAAADGAVVVADTAPEPRPLLLERIV